MVSKLEPIAYSCDLHADLFLLWNREYPKVLAYTQLADLEQYLEGLRDIKHFLYGDAGKVLAWAFVFTREERRKFAILIDRSLQRSGWGSKLLRQIMEEEAELNAWVMDRGEYLLSDGTSYSFPLDFYTKLGFTILSEHRLETPNFSAVRIQLKQAK